MAGVEAPTPVQKARVKGLNGAVVVGEMKGPNVRHTWQESCGP